MGRRNPTVPFPPNPYANARATQVHGEPRHMMTLDDVIADGRRSLAELQIAANYGDEIAALVIVRFGMVERQVMAEWNRMWMTGGRFDSPTGGLELLLAGDGR